VIGVRAAWPLPTYLSVPNLDGAARSIRLSSPSWSRVGAPLPASVEALEDLRERLLVLGELLLTTPAGSRSTLPVQLAEALRARGHLAVDLHELAN
jgi:hypothetical protein